VANITLYDGAHDFRITIKGKFTGPSVEDVARSWESALSEKLPRRYMVDISGLSGYDTAGRRLLRDMHKHGVAFAAATPMSLVFLNEISGTQNRAVPLMTSVVPEEAQDGKRGPARTAVTSTKRAASAH
jgi:hypothetical protein